MSVASKTGLLASPKKKIVRLRRAIDITSLAPCAVTRQVQFALRPFGGLFNPYSKGCSILCNHPAAIELKKTVKEAKEAWMVEGKAFLHREELVQYAIDDHVKHNNFNDLPDHVPEEFFRRYTDTDSRPLTPTPTVASGRTRMSAGGSLLNARRCVTPDPLCTNIKERKQLILDLRRSHSQETLFWNASSELSPAPAPVPWSAKKGSANKKINEKNKSLDKSFVPNAANIPKIEPEPLMKEDSQICINARDEDEEDDEPRRRGRKRKKSKTTSAIPSTFHPNQDPETQVATLGPDSPNLSNRPSLIPNQESATLVHVPQSKFNTFNIHEENRSACFLDESVLKILQRGLNLDIVENTFERHLNRALKEAYLTLPQDKLKSESNALKTLREQMSLPQIDHDRWTKLPRKYSRASSRFELPLDSKELTNMTPLKYLHNNVDVIKAQKQIFRRVFHRYLPKELDENPKILKPTPVLDDDDEDEDEDNIKIVKHSKKVVIDLEERMLPNNDLKAAMKEALGFHGTDEKINEILEVLDLKSESICEITFRTWSGILAFSERYLNQLDRNLDPCNEIEIADFESLERRIASLDISDKLSNVLKLIKYK